jgi:hypothetical protein
MPLRHIGDGDVAPSFLTSAINSCELSASCFGRFTPWEMSAVHIDCVGLLATELSRRCGEEGNLVLSGTKSLRHCATNRKVTGLINDKVIF